MGNYLMKNCCCNCCLEEFVFYERLFLEDFVVFYIGKCCNYDLMIKNSGVL